MGAYRSRNQRIALKSIFPDVTEVVVLHHVGLATAHGERGGASTRDVASRGRWTRWERLRTVCTRRAGGDGDVARRVRRAKRVRAVITSVCGRENRVFRDARQRRARDAREDARARDVDANVFLASKTRGFADARVDARRELPGSSGAWWLIGGARPVGALAGVGEEETLTSVAAFFHRARSGFLAAARRSGNGFVGLLLERSAAAQRRPALWGWLTLSAGGRSSRTTGDGHRHLESDVLPRARGN